MNTPILVPIDRKKDLKLYLSNLENNITSLLIVEDSDGIQCVIYYLNRGLKECRD